MKARLQQIMECAHPRTVRVIRGAWLDEKLDALSQGDSQRLEEATKLVDACEQRLLALRSKPKGILSWLGNRVAGMH